MESSIIIEPSAWRYSQLSLADRFGGIRINGREYSVDRASDCLVRNDWAGVVRAVGAARAKELIREGYRTAASAMAFIRKEREERKARNNVKQQNLF